MKNTYNLSLGWKGSQSNNPAMIKRKSRFDFWLSIIIAFLVIFVIGQLIGAVDQLVRDPLSRSDLSWWNPVGINSASAASINEANMMIVSNNDIQVLPDSQTTVKIGFKNQGSKTWNQTGNNKVEIFLKKGTTLYKRGEMTTVQNASGQIGYFNLLINSASYIGNYRYQYVLARNGKEIISGSSFLLGVTVVKTLNATAAQSISTPAANTSTSVAVATSSPAPVKNAEVKEPVYAGRICMDYSIKKFLLTAETQKIIDDCKRIGVDLTPNIFIESSGNSSPVSNNSGTDDVSNSADEPATTNTNTAAGDADGPMIRVGLYSTTEPILFTANAIYKIVDRNNAVLARVTPGMTTTITFNFSSHTYTFNANGQTMATNSYLRLEPETAGTVLEISSLYQIPAWNQTLNFNKFLGSLEVRYSPNTNKLWVINEIQLEYYLKGLAETSNISPMEYQKALITAARTYAMYHYNRGTKHAAEYFTVDATYDQVYRGYGSQMQLPAVSDAVEQTKGQVVTYNGEVVVTPYFAHSDGRTRDWTEVWGGAAKPWCVSVAEPANYDKTVLWGHGVGMSAHGAIHLAYHYNYTFDNILKYYYTGIEVKKIY